MPSQASGAASGLNDAMSRYETSRGLVSYPDRYDMEQAMRRHLTDDNKPGAWLHASPQRLDLGRIGLHLRSTPGGEVETDPTALTGIHQELDLWTGIMETSFRYAGEMVRIQTAASPDSPRVGFRINFELRRPPLTARRLRAGPDHSNDRPGPDGQHPARGHRQLGLAKRLGLGLPRHGDDRSASGNPDLGIDRLLKAGAKNRHTDVGHNPQMWGILPLYLPGNGSLLAAVSLIAAGDDAPALRWASHPRAMSCWTSPDKRFPPFGQQRIASSAGVGGAGSTS